LGNIITSLFRRAPDEKAIQQMVDERVQAELKGLVPTMLAGIKGPLTLIANYQGVTNDQQLVQRGYCGNSDVYSIVKLIAKTAAMIPLYEMEQKDEKEARKYHQMMLTKNLTPEIIYNIGQQREKAYAIVGEQGKLQQLLDNPDDQQNKQDVYEGFYGFRLITGNSYINTPIIPDGANKGMIQGMYSMPAQYVNILATMGFPKRVISYQMIVNSIEVINTDEVIHLKYFNPDWSLQGQELYGLSPLRAANKTLQRSNSAEDNSVAQYQNGGPAAFIGNKNVDVTDMGIEQTGKIKDRFMREYAGTGNAGKIAFTPGEPVYVAAGLSPVDLGILQSERFTLARLCNVYGVSDVLFNNNEASTESNVAEMVKRLYTNAALPEVYALRDAINRKIAPRYAANGRKRYVDCDITGITELQDDMQAVATWLNTAWWITPNEKRDVQKFGKYPDASFDQPWVTTGSMPLSEALMPIDPLPNDPNGNNENL